jgi:hypothetical protein
LPESFLRLDSEERLCFGSGGGAEGLLMSELGNENRDSFLKGDFLILGREISTTRDESGVEGIVTLGSWLVSRD